MYKGRGGVGPPPAVVRFSPTAGGAGRWHVLPGGMTRVARSDDSSVSMQRGGSSLDLSLIHISAPTRPS